MSFILYILVFPFFGFITFRIHWHTLAYTGITLHTLARTHCWHTHSAGTHTVLACTQCWHAHSVGTHTVLVCTQCWHAHSAGTHTVLACTQCWHAHIAGMHTVLACTQCWHAHGVGMHTVLACTQCWYAHGVGMHTVLVRTRCWHAHSVGMHTVLVRTRCWHAHSAGSINTRHTLPDRSHRGSLTAGAGLAALPAVPHPAANGRGSVARPSRPRPRPQASCGMVQVVLVTAGALFIYNYLHHLSAIYFRIFTRSSRSRPVCCSPFHFLTMNPTVLTGTLRVLKLSLLCISTVPIAQACCNVTRVMISDA